MQSGRVDLLSELIRMNPECRILLFDHSRYPNDFKSLFRQNRIGFSFPDALIKQLVDHVHIESVCRFRHDGFPNPFRLNAASEISVHGRRFRMGGGGRNFHPGIQIFKFDVLFIFADQRAAGSVDGINRRRQCNSAGDFDIDDTVVFALKNNLEMIFGIGVESYTVGSNDFYMMYAARRGKMICLDSGHFHPTESIADKLSAVISQQGSILLHVSRGVRWDSDHVIVLNDELLSIAREAVAYGYLDKIRFCLDYFDASINRIAAWVIGARNLQKALLIALLEPTDLLRKEENSFDFSGRLARLEQIKTLPWNSVWNYYCESQNLPDDYEFMKQIRRYETDVLLKR